MVNRGLRMGFLAAFVGALVAGCSPDSAMPVGHAPAEEPDQPPPSSPVNRAPTIAGIPVALASVGSAYSFTPTASDADGDALVWSIAEKPANAAFSTTTGALTWTPDASGTWPGIVITVTDTRGASTSLAAFSITVAAPGQANGSASLSWTAPDAYTDGTSLPAADLIAYRIYAGSDAATLDRVAEVDGRTTNFVAANLARGTHYFAVTAVSASGAESTLSAVGSKTVL